MKLPVYQYDTKDLLTGASDGSEQIVTADEYLQPQRLYGVEPHSRTPLVNGKTDPVSCV